MAGNKYFISYFVLASYAISVFLLSLLLVLLLSLAGVDRTSCKDDSKMVASVNKVVNNALKQSEIKGPQQPIDPKKKLHKRLAIDEKYFQLMKTLKENEYRKPEFKNVKETPTCEALFQTDVNRTLWESQRLPTNIIPKRYVVEFFSPYFSLGIYNGQVDIYLDITEDVNTFIVHAHLLNVFLPFLRDNTNTILSLQCADYYPLNEYFVIRTNSMVRKSQAPLRLTLQFDGFLHLYESGVFSIQYGPGSEFNG